MVFCLANIYIVANRYEIFKTDGDDEVSACFTIRMNV